ncbi:hypothetical protein FACS1894159_05620 [Bacteroidia bacterium]|nr:hypothetical protein FACS1894159_05620 [Bacteroidia bacterium]
MLVAAIVLVGAVSAQNQKKVPRMPEVVDKAVEAKVITPAEKKQLMATYKEFTAQKNEVDKSDKTPQQKKAEGKKIDEARVAKCREILGGEERWNEFVKFREALIKDE